MTQLVNGYAPTPEGIAAMLVDAGIIPPCDESDAVEKLRAIWDA